MSKKIQLVLCAACLSFFAATNAQSIQNVKQGPFQDGKITVTYDIVGGRPDQKFSIELYSSHNNFNSPLSLVTGDVGKNITPGIGKKIIWNAADELVVYKGDISFKVRGNMMALPFAIKTPVVGTSVRRGKDTDVKWEGGSGNQNVKLELFNGSAQVMTLAETKNTGSFTWGVPKNLSKGNYTIKLTSGTESVSSGVFAVKPKVPLLLKALPILVIGGAVAALGGGGSKNNNKSSTGNPDLPPAPGPN